MYVPPAITKQAEIEAAIQRVQQRIGSDVVRIRYEVGEDWSGEWAIFFRVVLTDDAARNRLRDIATRVGRELARNLDFPAMGVFPYHNFRSESEQAVAGTSVGLADELLEDARHLAGKGIAENRASFMRRAVSTAYCAVFHLFVEDFVSNWPFPDQRARLARMFDHKTMRDASFTPANEKNPTPAETALVDVKTAFRELQADRHRVDYDLSWNIVGTDVQIAVTLAEQTFAKWRSIRTEEITRHYLLLMFGAKR